MIIDLKHNQSAHCESGVMSSMLTHHGVELSEAMAFGLSSALTFAYIPIVKLNGMPLIAYRMPPKSIIKGLQKQLGIKIRFQRFRNADKGMLALDDQLEQSRLVGLQSSVFWLPYFPEDMRFHFNAHNMLVYGKKDNDYLISDPVFEAPVTSPAESLKKARFAKGALAAKGLMYYVEEVPDKIDFERAIDRAVKKNARIMTGAPLPVIGVRGIRHMAKKVESLDKTFKDDNMIKLYLGHIVRMQEEIGTGGAGFRFIYASFLQESANLIDSQKLADASKAMTEAGDTWRLFALNAAKMCKKRKAMDLNRLAEILNECADKEAAIWQQLKTGA